MEKSQYMMAVGAFVGFIALLFGIYKLTNQPTQTFFAEAKTLRADDHLRWSPDKKIILTEYSDLQCPACQYAFTQIKLFESDPAFANAMKKITFVYRHFPLPQIHQHALEGSYAAEAASKQGKFFEMHDMLFEKQEEWSTSDKPADRFIDYAKVLGLNIDQFKKDMDSQEVKDRVQKDMQSAATAQVNQTPTFYLNGDKHEVSSYSDFKQLLIDVAK